MFELSAKDDSDAEYQNLQLLDNATPEEAFEPNESIVARALVDTERRTAHLKT